MLVLRLTVYLACLWWLPFQAAGQHPDLRQKLEGILGTQDRADVPGPEDLQPQFDILYDASSAAEAAEVLPLARRCLRSSNLTVRRDGVATFLVVAMRPKDGAALLSGDIELLGQLLGDPERQIRGAVAYVFYAMQPAPPSAVVPHLLPHLEDEGNSERDILGLSDALLRAAPNDAAVLRALLNTVKRSPSDQPGLWAGLIRCFANAPGGAPLEKKQVIEFLAQALSGAEPEVQRSAIDAIRGRRDLLARFEPALVHIATDQHENRQTREAAEQALKGEWPFPPGHK